MFNNSYKLLFSLDQICISSVFSSLLEPSENKSKACIHFQSIVISTLFTFLLVQPINYTVSLCLATVSNHRINSLNGMSQSHAAHKWVSQSHQLTLVLTFINHRCKEKITPYVIVVDLFCVFCVTSILKSQIS